MKEHWKDISVHISSLRFSIFQFSKVKFHENSANVLGKPKQLLKASSTQKIHEREIFKNSANFHLSLFGLFSNAIKEK